MKNPKSSHAFEVIRELPEPLSGLQRLASNYWWTWDHEARDLFRLVDNRLWDECEHNPVLFLNRVSPERAARLVADRNFLERLGGSVRRMEEYLAGDTWFDGAFPGARERTTVAYFCAEFGVSEGLPIYSGGLGVLAGDHLKAASDLGVPLVAVGLLYNHGYFRQRLNRDGWQQEVYPQADFYQMPLTLMRNEAGHPICIDVDFPDRPVSCQIWRADVGRVPLYLLDSNVLDNTPGDQAITDTLYGGDQDTRARQEAILGIGGLRALEALGIRPTVCHMNEGHAAFLAIERIRQIMGAHGCEFRTAKEAATSGNVFTTHTPVEAGFDLFEGPLLEKTVARTVALTRLPFSEFLEMGKVSGETEEKFNMAVFAMENSSYVNGVSQLHASVSRAMFAERWPSYPEDEVPIEGITNGIHTTTWTSARMSALLDEHLGGDWRRRPEDPEVWAGVEAIPDDALWGGARKQPLDLVRYARRRHQADLERRGQGRPDPAEPAILDPRVLTIGFARRFATYKRATLMAADKERLKRPAVPPRAPGPDRHRGQVAPQG